MSSMEAPTSARSSRTPRRSRAWRATCCLSLVARVTTGSRPTPTPTVLYGGAGDDELVSGGRQISAASTEARASTALILGIGRRALDFTEASVRGKVRGIEVVSLSDATAMVTLDLASVYALIESRDNGGDHTSAGEAFLRLRGLTSDTVVLSDKSDWTKSRPTPRARRTSTRRIRRSC